MKGLISRAGRLAARYRTSLTTAMILGMSGPAFAQTANGGLPGGGGGIDPQTAITSALTYGMPLGGSVIAGQCMYNAIEAHHRGQGIKGHVAGGLGSIALGFGGAAVVQHLGGTVG